MPLLFSRKACAVAAVAAAFISLSSRCFADPISLSASAVSSTLLGPSADTLSLNAGSIVSDDSNPGLTTFQTGDFILGNSPIPDQIVPFSFEDSLSFNGITELLNISGQDHVTTTADTLSIFAGAPVVFGNDFFTLQPLSETGTAIGQDMPLELQASVTPTPEPSSLVLLGTGVLVATLLATLSRRSLVESIPATAAPTPVSSVSPPARTWVRRGATFHPAASDGARSAFQSTPVAGPVELRRPEDLRID